MIIWFSKQATEKNSRPILFLDRDGVINKEKDDFIRSCEDVVIYPDAFEGLAKAVEIGFRLVIISNQSGIGRGYITTENFWKVHQKIVDAFESKGIIFTAAFYCPHPPNEGCRCRKPSPEMLLFASELFDGSLRKSFFIGDRDSDMEAALRAGCYGRILLRRHSSIDSSYLGNNLFVCKDLSRAVDLISDLLLGFSVRQGFNNRLL